MGRLPEAVVWDLDGTLIDSAADLCRSLNRVLGELGHTSLDVQAVRPMIGNGVPKLVERAFKAVGRKLSATDLDVVVAIFMAHYSANPTAHTRLYPGVTEALETLAAAGVKQGLCTNKPEGVTRSILRQVKVDQYFSAVVGGDTTAARKPDPMPLQACIDTMGAAADRTIMIGDSAVDVGSARAVGIPIGLVAHGYRHTDLASIDADFVVEDIASVTEILATQIESAQLTAC